MKWYAIKQGLNPGIYTNWEQAKLQVEGVSKPIYKSFNSLEAAQEFMAAQPIEPKKDPKASAIIQPVPTFRETPFFAEFCIAGAFSVKTSRCAWALLCDRDLAQSQRYAGPLPEQKDRSVLCAILRLLTRANLDSNLKNKPILLHLGSPDRAIYQALTDWIKIWTKKKWNDGKVINIDLYKMIWPLLKTTNIKFRYHEPKYGEFPRLVQARELALKTADAD